MIKLALLGKNISHSQSPGLYKEFYGESKVDYQLLDFTHESEVPKLKILMRDLDGLNITSPYKELFVKDVIIADDNIKKLKAINCIGKRGDQYYATNTDFSAMIRLLPELAINKKILILGDGVMSRITQLACYQSSLSFEVWSRKLTPSIFRTKIVVDGNVLIINCCAREYIFSGHVSDESTFWDLNYLHDAHSQIFAHKSNYIDGLNLLTEQARDASAFWLQLKN